jgi:hypothetical protein
MRLFSEAPDQTRWIGVGAAAGQRRSGHANKSPDRAAVSDPPELLEEKDASDSRPALDKETKPERADLKSRVV